MPISLLSRKDVQHAISFKSATSNERDPRTTGNIKNLNNRIKFNNLNMRSLFMHEFSFFLWKPFKFTCCNRRICFVMITFTLFLLSLCLWPSFFTNFFFHFSCAEICHNLFKSFELILFIFFFFQICTTNVLK